MKRLYHQLYKRERISWHVDEIWLIYAKKVGLFVSNDLPAQNLCRWNCKCDGFIAR